MAVGDALGASVEFMTATEIRQSHGILTEIRGGGWLHLAPGQVTDDTQMALCIARSIAEHGWLLRDIADRFVAWLRSKPPDIGSTCRRGIRRYMHYGTLAGQPCESDAGNGAVMRMAPVAIASVADASLLEIWAREQAHVTHHHPLSDAACIHVGRLLHLAYTGRSRDALRRYVQGVVATVPQFGYLNYKGLCSAYVVDTMQTVFYHFFRSRSFEDCLIQTVNRGGDADTAGAIVGGIAGAFYGLEQIPQRWVTMLDRKLRAELLALSSGLVDRSPLARLRGRVA
jgi:ADP-ribosyl-[dinitrogen reductase] hydrolase